MRLGEDEDLLSFDFFDFLGKDDEDEEPMSIFNTRSTDPLKAQESKLYQEQINDLKKQINALKEENKQLKETIKRLEKIGELFD